MSAILPESLRVANSGELAAVPGPAFHLHQVIVRPVVMAKPSALAGMTRQHFALAGKHGGDVDHKLGRERSAVSIHAFDGIHETVPWVAIFWRGIYPVLAGIVGTHVAQPYLFLVNFYYYWQWLMLFLSPFIYLAIYLGFLALAKLITRTDKTLRELALTFAYSLVPIALVYNVTHYFTLLLAQGPSIASLISDPFGFGWNLFGTRSVDGQAILLDAGVIWHTQVWLILFGHIVSVYLSHVEALKVFKTTRQATLSQIPLLLLMVALTTIGLWILSLPIAAGQVLLPTPNSG